MASPMAPCSSRARQRLVEREQVGMGEAAPQRGRGLAGLAAGQPELAPEHGRMSAPQRDLVPGNEGFDHTHDLLGLGQEAAVLSWASRSAALAMSERAR